MRIDREGELGRALILTGIDPLLLRRARWIVWPFSSALTAPLPGGICLIFVPKSWRRYWAMWLAGYLHELCHVAQARRWGFLGYWRRHLWARIVTRSILAKDHPVERECYRAEEGIA